MLVQKPIHQSFFQFLYHFIFQTIQKKDRIISSQGSVWPRNAITNNVNNQKYNLFTFLPLFLFNEYKHFSNSYFLLIALLQLYPPFQIGFLITYLGPIIVVLSLSFVKEIWDDIKRKIKDRQINQQKYSKIVFQGEKIIQSQDIKVGDILRLQKNQRVPADLILLFASDQSGLVYVKTDQLDGETDWKVRESIKLTQELGNQNILDIYKQIWKINVEQPCDQIYDFKGTFIENSENFQPLKLSNTLWANMTIASGEIIGIVIYTGKETRSQQNSKKPQSKMGKTDKEINIISKILFIVLLLITIILFLLGESFLNGNWLINLVRIFLLLCAIIPISMKVNLDFAKLKYTLDINKDKDLIGIVARNSSIPEELGRIQILLSDKTGTLTKNEMIFKNLITPFQNFSKENENSLKVLLKNLPQNNNYNFKENLMILMNCLCICNNVTPVDDRGERILQASSPDEIALVKQVENLGYFLQERNQTKIKIQTPWQELLEFEILENFPFDSSRKRMGIIVRELQTQEIYFYIKGADNVMRELIKEQEKSFIDEETETLANEGLRTLVLGYKKLYDEEYQEFKQQYINAGKDMKRREEKEKQILEQIEYNLNILGITGVEDLLQDNIKNVMISLKEAGINVWMLTGDKLETAKCIAISTGFKSNQQTFFEIIEQDSQKIKQRLKNYLYNQHLLVVDGNTLSIIMKDSKLKKFFFKKTLYAISVVLCRCAPKQKAEVAQYIKQKFDKIVCCIGDGGNDVGMIQSSSIGIGIEGKEGMQAALSSDFSVLQFKQILKLILWHGRLSYNRTSLLVNFVIHRGLIISFIEVYFLCTFYFVTIFLYNGYLTLGYSTIFTSLPVFSLIWNTDIPIDQIYNYPVLYSLCQRGNSLSIKIFFIWLWKSAFQGGIIFLLSILLIQNSFIKIVTITFTCLIIIEFLNIYTSIQTWHRYILYSLIFSAIIYMICLFYLKELFLLSELSGTEYLTIILISFIAWLPFQCFTWLQKFFYPSQVDKVIQEGKIEEQRMKFIQKRRKEEIEEKPLNQFNYQINLFLYMKKQNEFRDFFKQIQNLNKISKNKYSKQIQRTPSPKQQKKINFRRFINHARTINVI